MEIQRQKMMLDEQQSVGLWLAENKWQDYMEGLESTRDQMTVSILLENQSNYLDMLTETTTTYDPGLATYHKYAFPLIRSIYPNLVSTELVSVQPMLGPTSMVFYLQIVYGSTKGAAVAGTDIHENPDMYYAGEYVPGETGFAGTGTGPYTNTLSWTPIRPNSVSITDGVEIFHDDGAGSLYGDAGGTGTITYSTGAIAALTFAASTTASLISADYEYNSEGVSREVPELDIMLTGSPVIARGKKLRARWSMEAAANMRALHGLEAEVELTAVLAEEIKFEVDREIIEELWRIAGAGAVSWDMTPPSGISARDHRETFSYKITEASNLIFAATRRAEGNWIVCGTGVANIIETMQPRFKPSGMIGQTGVINIGVLDGKYSVYKDPYFGMTGSQTTANSFLLGHKGASFLDTGFVYAPYIPFYQTPLVTLDDFVHRKGIGTQFGKKVCNKRFYVPGSVFSS